MRLVQDHSFGATAVSVPCLACGRMVRLVDAIIDADGPAFRAYYHVACAPAGIVAPCAIGGCRREHVLNTTRPVEVRG